MQSCLTFQKIIYDTHIFFYDKVFQDIEFSDDLIKKYEILQLFGIIEKLGKQLLNALKTFFRNTFWNIILNVESHKVVKITVPHWPVMHLE